MLMTDVPTWEEKTLLIVLPSMVEEEKFSDHPRIYIYFLRKQKSSIEPGFLCTTEQHQQLRE
jgi:hypothetical protein